MSDLYSGGEKHCKECGVAIPVDSQFCPQCGAKQSVAPAPVPSNAWFTQAGSLDDSLGGGFAASPASSVPPCEDPTSEAEEPSTVHSGDVGQTPFIKPIRRANGASSEPAPYTPNPVPEDSLVVEESYCKNCGAIVHDGSELCASCESSMHMAGQTTTKEKQGSAKPASGFFAKHKILVWTSVVACVAVIIAVALFSMGGSNGDDRCPYCSGTVDFSKDVFCPDCGTTLTGIKPDGYYEDPGLTDTPATNLSDDCDFTLSNGTDTDGNFYELVANQTESATGFRIEVGVIKNNEWIYPLSADFPFLNSEGLFPVENDSLSLSNPNRVINNIYFVDNGGFMLESTRSYPRTVRYFFDCDSLQMISDEFTGQRNLLYIYSSTKYKNYGDYGVESFGKIYTDNGRLCIVDWFDSGSNRYGHVIEILDLNEQSWTTIASESDYYAKSALSEGLMFASDGNYNYAFFDTNWNKVIDLSEYNIDLYESRRLYFSDGTCTFVAKNDIGTKFDVTIDKSGNVINEVKRD